jgi:hypothetical protein
LLGRQRLLAGRLSATVVKRTVACWSAGSLVGRIGDAVNGERDDWR